MPAEDGQAAGGVAGSFARREAALPKAEEELARVDLERTPLNDIDAEHRRRVNEAAVKWQEITASQADDDRKLRKMIASRVFWAITAQVVIADVAFLIYGFWNSWKIPGSTINAWLAATVVQVIAVGLVITRSLFPSAAKALVRRAS
ncbi:MAG TPA: hypothetical protein VE972_04115 [Conexibacter sp.]|nr:hypothetical protein [Conexibacter sp.]